MPARRRIALLGLDGCGSNAWVVAEGDLDFRSLTFRTLTNLTPLFDQALQGSAVAVLDVPIGLSHEPRACDRAARALLGKRHVCVFTPPCRQALIASTFDQAKEINRAHCNGVAISQQAFNILSRIRAVDDLITPEHQVRLREGHPEVSFAALNRNQPLAQAKNTAKGIADRMALLTAAGVPAFDPVSERSRLGRAFDVKVDDVIDAAVMLLTARHVAQGIARPLPHTGEHRDERGLLMEMAMPSAAPEAMNRPRSDVRRDEHFANDLSIEDHRTCTESGSKAPPRREENSVYYVGIRTYVAVASREKADEIARREAQRAAGRVWIEGTQSASGREHSSQLGPEAVAAELERVLPQLRSTPEQQQRRDKALTFADATTWRRIVLSCIAPLLHSYERGELTHTDALELVDRISIGCLHQARIQLLGTVAYLAHRTPQRELKSRPPKYPQCIRSGTADLVLVHMEKSPTERLNPSVGSRRKPHDPSSPLVRKTLDVLTAIDWFGPAGAPAAHTVAGWVRARRREAGQTLRKGARRKSPPKT